MSLWGMTADERRLTIGRWAMDGLPWQTWTVRTMTYVLYRELVQGLYEAGHVDGPHGLRSFLRLCGDTYTLGQLDRGIMGQSGGVVPEPTPQLRGRANG